MTGRTARDYTTPMHAEPVRSFIEETIKHAFGLAAEQPAQPPEIKSMRAFRTGPSETRVQASLDNGTTRTFTIALRENK